jgi:hypothetical protein
MKTFLIALVFVALAVGCRDRESVKKEAALPSDFSKLPLLSEESAFPPEYLAGVRAVQKDLISKRENPAEFRTWIRKIDDGKTLVFSVIHLTSLEERYRNSLGNPSGKDRAIVFDIASGKIVSSLLTQ